MLRLLLLATLVVYCQAQDAALRRLCNAQVVCRDCIAASPDCVWCAATQYNDTRFRCFASTEPMLQTLCPDMLQNPKGGVDMDSAVRPDLEGFNQVSPTKVSVTVRPGDPQTFELNVRPARNFPIDLYLLMDLSFSMRDDLANLKRLGADLAASIVSLSNNFSIGFGSFVEKRVSPFLSLNPAVQEDPCMNDNRFDCEPTYTYRHVISLTNDSNRFNNLVQAQNISGNQDLPEGGFDGFLQSILCTNLIGWRDVSRKLLLYITDAGFHMAGDGKLGGIILPHQSICRLPSEVPPGASQVEYSEFDTELYDYPSVGQIAQALREQDIIPIFAAQARVRGIYDALAQEIGEGAFTDTLATDSSNVVGLVERLYNTISQRVIFEQEQVPGVSITVRPTRCPGFVIDGVCNGLAIEQVASFDVSVTVTECTPELRSGSRVVSVRVVGFSTFEVNLTAICQCPCDSNTEENSLECNRNGTLTCGQCVCNPGNFGERCQCDALNQGAQLECPLGDNDLQCSGRGMCVCGVCNCQSGFFGAACECDESACINQDTGLLCSGRGTCGCDGQCTCNVEPVSQLPYRGDPTTSDPNTCQCTPNTQTCRDPSNRNSICNGRGVCGCNGICECEDPYFGTFCELCSGSDICLDINCPANLECANCAIDIIAANAGILELEDFFTNETVISQLPMGSIFSNNAMSGVLEVRLPRGHCPVCSESAIIIDGSDTADYEIDGEPAQRCEIFRGNCIYAYFIAIDTLTNNFTDVHVEFTSCLGTSASSGSIEPWIAALIIIAALFTLGILALILLKIFLVLLDIVEVRKFEQELAKTKYSKNENPLYRSATKDYQNPLYGR